MEVDSWAVEERARLRREQAVVGTTALFFVSGATALVYQTLWNRDLHLVFGTSSFAIATVLSAFMLGLALGGAVMARRADHIARPLRVYGLLEVGIGLYALVFPYLVDAVTPIYLATFQALQPGPVLFGVIQFVVVGSLLVLPTAAMGATLPLLARFATTALGGAGDRIGTLYAVNTAGAVAGTWLAGFYLLPEMGLWTTTVLAATANVALGTAAVGLDAWYDAPSATVEVKDDLEQGLPPLLLPVGLALGLAGFSSLVYEVAWTRVLGLMVGASVYGFSVMLLAFLVGIAVGGKLGGLLADRVLKRAGARGVLLALAATEVGVAGLSYTLMYVFPELPFWYVWIFDWTGAASDPSMMWVTSLFLAGAVMTPPAVLMGVAFPMAVRAVVGDQENLGGPVGRVYAANTVGGVLGSFAAGFLLLPNVGIQATIFTAALVNLLAATVVLVPAGGRVWAGGVGLSAALVSLFALARPPWDPLLMTSGMYHYVTSFEDHTREGIERYAVSLYELVFYEEGLSTVVTVARNKSSDNMWLANNGKVDASTTSDMPTQVLCALLAMQYAEDPSDVLLIGLASGITAGAIATVDDVDRFEIVELEPAIERAARLFGDFNGHVLDDPRVRLVGNDGRNHLLMAPERSFDVIVSEPSNPWITGVSNLFTREFWEMGKTRLKPGGVWSQWVQMYGMDDGDLRSLLTTFASVYPYVVLYATIEDADLVLVGSESPLVPDAAHAARLFRKPRVHELLTKVGVNDPNDMVAMFQMDHDDIVAATAGDPFNTDDNMRIEYNAPLNLHKDTNEQNGRFLRKNVAVPDGSVVGHAAWADLARAFERKGDSSRALLAYAKAVESSPDADSRVLYEVEATAIVERIKASVAETAP
ncbi:MAG: fused MFS/spermidine synthase [Myxococcales bacterium]|nr:fused MFS/spermidine synthase [Myxococcales bacterium]